MQPGYKANPACSRKKGATKEQSVRVTENAPGIALHLSGITLEIGYVTVRRDTMIKITFKLNFRFDYEVAFVGTFA